MKNPDLLDDIDLIHDDINKTIKAHKRKGAKAQKIYVRSSVEKARDDYKEARRLQRENIRKARTQIASYKLLIKQAKNTYKLVKLANK